MYAPVMYRISTGGRACETRLKRARALGRGQHPVRVIGSPAIGTGGGNSSIRQVRLFFGGTDAAGWLHRPHVRQVTV